MRNRDGIRLALYGALVLTPGIVLAQTPANDPEPPLDPLPVPGSTTAPKADRLPPLNPLPRAADEPQDTTPPLRSVVRPGEPMPGESEVVVQGSPTTVMVEENDADEVIIESPTIVRPSQRVWVAGRFEKQPDSMIDIAGRWEKPLIGAPRYIAPHQRRQIGKVVWVPGHWVEQPAPVVVSQPIVVSAPTTTVVARPAVTTVDPSVKVVTTQVTAVPARKYIPGQWKQNVLGQWKYTPARWVP